MQLALSLINKIKSLGGDAYVVGGAVRDYILGDEPNDIDIATNVPMNILEREFKCVDIGKNKDFGILVIEWEGQQFEVAQFRTEGQYSDSRHPDSVEFVKTIEEDLARRDFTINAMAYDGEKIIDPFGGQNDLKKGIIRFVGNSADRINEDTLRVLRAYRFAAKYKFKIADEEYMNGSTLHGVSQERITNELRKVAGYGGPALAFFIDRTTWNQIYILPELKCSKHGYSNIYPHSIQSHPEGDVFQHIIHCLCQSSETDYLANLCVLFHDIGKYETLRFKGTDHAQSITGTRPTYYGHDKKGAEMMVTIGERLKLSNDEIKTIQFVCENHMIRWDLSQMKLSRIAEIGLHKDYKYLVHTCGCDEMSRLYMGDRARRMAHAILIRHMLKDYKTKKELTDMLRYFVDGERIMDLTGLQGKDIGRIKKTTEAWITDMNGQVTQDQVNNFILSQVKPHD